MPDQKRRPFRDGAVLLGGEQSLPTKTLSLPQLTVIHADGRRSRNGCSNTRRVNCLERRIHPFTSTAKDGEDSHG